MSACFFFFFSLGGGRGLVFGACFLGQGAGLSRFARDRTIGGKGRGDRKQKQNEKPKCKSSSSIRFLVYYSFLLISLLEDSQRVWYRNKQQARSTFSSSKPKEKEPTAGKKQVAIEGFLFIQSVPAPAFLLPQHPLMGGGHSAAAETPGRCRPRCTGRSAGQCRRPTSTRHTESTARC